MGSLRKYDHKPCGPVPHANFQLDTSSASILELPKMTPRWPLTPNSWTPLLPPPPPTWWSLYRNITNIHQGIFEKKHFVILDTQTDTHMPWHKLSKFSLSPFALPPPKFWCWCHHCYYLHINRKLYITEKHIFLTSPTHSIITNHMNFMNLGVLNLFTLHHCTRNPNFKTIGYRADIPRHWSYVRHLH